MHPQDLRHRLRKLSTFAHKGAAFSLSDSLKTSQSLESLDRLRDKTPMNSANIRTTNSSVVITISHGRNGARRESAKHILFKDPENISMKLSYSRGFYSFIFKFFAVVLSSNSTQTGGLVHSTTFRSNRRNWAV